MEALRQINRQVKGHLQLSSLCSKRMASFIVSASLKTKISGDEEGENAVKEKQRARVYKVGALLKP